MVMGEPPRTPRLASWQQGGQHRSQPFPRPLQPCIPIIGMPPLRRRTVAQQLPVADLLQPGAWASQTVMLTAGLMVTSAALGYCARGLLEALPSVPSERGSRAAWRPASAQAAADESVSEGDEEGTCHMPQFWDMRDAESSSTGRELEACSGDFADQSDVGTDGVVPFRTEPEGCPAPERLWEAAWEAFEPRRVPEIRVTESVAPAAAWQFPGLPGTRRSAAKHARQGRAGAAGAPEAAVAAAEEEADAVLRAQLSLQGISPRPRARLLACALAALEQQIASLAERPERALSEDEWAALMPALLASSERAAAEAWLGYTPEALLRQAPAAQQQALTSDASEQSMEAGDSSPISAVLSVDGQPRDVSASSDVASDTNIDTEMAGLYSAIVAYMAGSRQDAQSAATISGHNNAGPEKGTAAAGQAVASAGGMKAGASRRQLAASQLAASDRTMIRGWGHDRAAVARGAPAPAGRSIAPSLLRSAPAVLQDMAVAVAEAVAEAYLAEAGAGAGRPGSVGRDGQRPGAWPLFLHPRIGSTRALERFRNQVAMQRWVAANVTSVVALYEDRYELWGFTRRGRLIRRALPARRAKELAGLRGARYAVSLALEALDFAAPLLQRALARLADALAWLLVRLIGRSLGLVYRGVRESLSPAGRKPRAGQTRRGAPPRPRYAPL